MKELVKKNFIIAYGAKGLVKRLEMVKKKPKQIIIFGVDYNETIQQLKQYDSKFKIVEFDSDASKLNLSSKNTSFFLKLLGSFFVPNQIHFKWNDIDHYVQTDVIVSNFYLIRYPNNFEPWIKAWERLLIDGGLLFFTHLGTTTLCELDRIIPNKAVNLSHLFLDMHDMGDILLQYSFKEPVVDMDLVRFTYKKFQTVILDLEKLNVLHLILAHYQLNLDEFERFLLDYIKNYGQIELTYEFLYGHAIKAKKELKEQQINFYKNSSIQ